MMGDLPYPWWGWFAMVFFFVGVVYIFTKFLMRFEDRWAMRNSTETET